MSSLSEIKDALQQKNAENNQTNDLSALTEQVIKSGVEQGAMLKQIYNLALQVGYNNAPLDIDVLTLNSYDISIDVVNAVDPIIKNELVSAANKNSNKLMINSEAKKP